MEQKTLLLIISSFIVIPLLTKSQTVIVHKDPNLDKLAAMQITINKRAQERLFTAIRGFRIQVANTQSRDEAVKVKAELLHRFPQERSYLLYKSPNFIVRIGNFVRQKEASPLRTTISALYPDKGIYIIPDIVTSTIGKAIKK